MNQLCMVLEQMCTTIRTGLTDRGTNHVRPFLCHIMHYENLHRQYTGIFFVVKIENFIEKKI